MSKRELAMSMRRLARQAARDNELTWTANIMDDMADVMVSAGVDYDSLVGRVQEVFAKPTLDPINALLGVFGLRIINKQGTLNDLRESFVVGVDGEGTGLPLMIDEGTAVEALGTMADDLKKFEERRAADVASADARYNKVFDDLASTEKELSQLRIDYALQHKAVAETAQRILGAITEQEAAAEPYSSLVDMLDSLDMSVVWEAGADDEERLFNVLRTRQHEELRTVPCILGEGDVVAKGTRFVAPATQPEDVVGTTENGDENE